MTTPIYKDSTLPVDKRVEDLLGQMTMDEKLGQLNQLFSDHKFPIAPKFDEQARQGEISSFIWAKAHPAERNRIQRVAVEESRLGIPIIFGMDIIHGNRTIFPIAPAMACSFEPELFEKAQAVAAKETRAEGVEWTFAPMCDMARDHRWGRVAETCGEDPYLSSLCNVAQVRGFQGEDASASDRVAACLKHYVGYSSPRGGRDYSDTEITEWTLRNTHLPTFKACVENGALSIMSGFNAIGGIPAVANRHTLTEILRDEWGFKGFVVSDWNAVKEQISWGFAKDEADSAKFAITAGNDMDMLGLCYIRTLAKQVEDGTVSMEVIDTAVRRVLGIKFQVGLFETPYVDEAAYEATILKPESRAIAREAVTKSTVLIKNEGALPLADSVKKIALIGPFVDDKSEMIGTWAGRAVADDMVTLLEGIQARFGDQAEIVVVKGCNVNNQPQIVCLQDGSTVIDKDASEDVELDIAGAVEAAKNADVVIMALGEPKGLTGEGGSRATLGVTGHQQGLFDAVAAATDTPIVSVIFSGRTLATPEIFKQSNAVLLAWQPGIEAGNGLADLISGDVAPSARLSMSVPYCVGQVPLYYNHYVTGRRSGGVYRDAVPTAANYWFGYGLTYTSFEYSGIELIPAADGKPAEAVGTVTNTGDREGIETAQLYIRQLACNHAARPMQELRGFQRLTLQPGESAQVRFPITDEVLHYVDRQGKTQVDKGEFHMWVAPHARCGEPLVYKHE
jgi:beta-glucosidase